MQCLFCGKELALLKRLRGGVEFCSEAHRKEYQDQYEQLALARLLQAKPPTEPAAPFARPSAPPLIAPDASRESAFAEGPSHAWQQSQDKSHPAVAVVEASSQSAAREPAEESSPAPLAGFLSEPLVPAVTPFQWAGLLELERVLKGVMTPPRLHAAVSTDSAASAPPGLQGCLSPAPPVELELSMRGLDHHTRVSERGVEVREFTAPAPVMELHLRPDPETEPAGSADVMEILMSPHPPQKAHAWLAVPRGFTATPAELGQLARLDFTTIGFAYSDGPASANQVEAVQALGAPQAAVLAPEPPQAEPPAQSVFETAEVAASVPPEPAPPELVTKVLPVTLHGLAALRGKSAQTFNSAITAASDVQIPVSAALPLRPAIVFGPPPAPPRAPESAAAPVQPKPVQPKPVQSTPVQPAPARPQLEERVRSSVVPAPKPGPVRRPAAAGTGTPAQERSAPKVPAPAALPVGPRAEQRKERPAHRFVEPASAFDAAIPSLRLEATESAWSKLSTGLKAGIAAAVIVGLFGIGYLVTRGNGKTVSEAPIATPTASPLASGVPISGGWIDDWADAARSRRHISMLSGSTKLSDYRLEFQAQIETKAIGWVFRGLNPRNYYVAKLETTKPGLEPTVALVHFAVIDGQDENRVVIPLPMKVRVDTTYKIRFDSIGNRFTTWVQGEKIAEWTDSRFGSGGVGFFSERDEHAARQGTVNVVALVPKN